MEILCGGEFYGNLTADLFQLGRFHFNNLVISMPEKTWASVVKIQNMLRITTWNHEIRITHSTAKLYTNSFTASPKVLKIFSHPQTRDQSQVVQNDKLSQGSVETKIFIGGNGTFSHFFEKKLKKMWEKISKKKIFFY